MTYDYIPNDFGKTWVAARTEARRGIYTPLAYIDINEGNRTDADLFAQIMYWHEPSLETGNTRLNRQKDGFYWLAKNHGDWWAETRIKAETARKSIKQLVKRGLIILEAHGQNGKSTPWLRINWPEFERRMRLWIDNNIATLPQKDADLMIHNLFGQGSSEKSTNSGKIYHPPLVKSTTPLVENPVSNTETTTESDLEISLPGDTNVVSPPENELPEEPDLTIYEDAVESLDMDDLEAPPTEPDPLESKAALQMAVTHTWNTNPDEWGKWNGLMRNFVTGRVDTKSKGTLWDKFKIDDPPMTPVEVVGFGMWYEDEFPDQEGIPKGLELLSQRIGLFRVAINYERACEVGRETLAKLMKIEAQSPLGESELATEADLAEIEAALAAMRAGVQS